MNNDPTNNDPVAARREEWQERAAREEQALDARDRFVEDQENVARTLDRELDRLLVEYEQEADGLEAKYKTRIDELRRTQATRLKAAKENVLADPSSAVQGREVVDQRAHAFGAAKVSLLLILVVGLVAAVASVLKAPPTENEAPNDAVVSPLVLLTEGRNAARVLDLALSNEVLEESAASVVGAVVLNDRQFDHGASCLILQAILGVRIDMECQLETWQATREYAEGQTDCEPSIFNRNAACVVASYLTLAAECPMRWPLRCDRWSPESAARLLELFRGVVELPRDAVVSTAVFHTASAELEGLDVGENPSLVDDIASMELTTDQARDFLKLASAVLLHKEVDTVERLSDDDLRKIRRWLEDDRVP